MRLFLAALLALTGIGVSARAQTVLFSDDFESGTSQWALTAGWRLLTPSDPCAAIVNPLPSGTQCLRWGSAASCDFLAWPLHGTASMTTPIALPTGSGSIDLSFATNSDAENWPDGDWDARRVFLSTDGGTSWVNLPMIYNSPWYRHAYDLTSYAGQSVLVRFDFDAVDGFGNYTRGWFIDDVAITSRAEPGVPFCFGDWCPCSNLGASGNGCATSFNPAGGNLSATGAASVSADTVVLATSGVSNSVVTFFQGTSTVFNSMYGPAAFGDGRRCVSGSIVRLQATLATGGNALYPRPNETSVSVRGAIPAAGGTRSYQVWYRNAASFCTASTFNVTNGLIVTWQP